MRYWTSLRVLSLIAICMSGLPMPSAASEVAAGTVRTQQGAVTGIAGEAVTKFLGIPYAAAPVGELRWRPPAPPPVWSGVRNAETYGPMCPQVPRESYPQWLKDHFAKTGMDEDCLTLNIWTPNEPGNEPLPVMFYIHGGNMKFGSGSYPLYDGSILAQAGVVVVTINYRVGFLGRFAHSAITRLQAGEPLANYGLMDQIAALEWVRDNIAAFGGDRDNVTIFGHSAGGVSVNYLMVMPASKGLFHKAIAQGSAISIDRERRVFERGPPGPLGPSWEDVGNDFASHFEIAGDDREIAAALRQLPTESILPYQNKLQITFNPSVDGNYVPDDPAKIFEQGKQHDVPYIAGANSWEWNQINNIPLIGKWFLASAFLEGLSDEELAVFDDQWTRIGASQRWFAEGLFLMSTRYLAAQMSSVTSPAYLYHVTFVQENLRGSVPGAAHGVEVPFIFGHVREHPEYQRPEVVELTDKDLAWGDTVRAYWISFAKSGDPNGDDRPEWPTYDSSSDVLLDLGESIQPSTGMYKESLDNLEEGALARRKAFDITQATTTR